MSGHLLASKRRRKELGSLIHEPSSAPVSETAHKLMANMGWKPNTGLGKRRDGIVSHIVAVKRADQAAGLGTNNTSLTAEQLQHGGAEWWKDAVGNTLAKLGKKSSSSSKSSSKKDKKTSEKKMKEKRTAVESKLHYTDQELFEATGGKRFGMRAAPSSNLHKWKRTNDEIHATNATAGLVEDTNEATIALETRSITALTEQIEAADLETTTGKDDKKKEKKAKKDKKPTKDKEKKRKRE
ncbi:hypothetical protein MPSEU_000355300 [Mayamaea pseudoterrestris]|nr:hypothetical protein MPSEU_000355300 [Mayamaea pseudoterrestris]